MKASIAVALLLVSGSAFAKEPTSIGGGQYMLSDQNFTIFGSTDKIVSKLMQQAQEFCSTKNGKEAVLVQSDGSEAVPGRINNSGRLQQGARGATGTIYFQCGAPELVAPVTSSSDKYEALAKVKALLDSGALTQDEYDAEKKKIMGE